MSLAARPKKPERNSAPPPPPTPRILNLPRRIRRRRICRTAVGSYGGRPVVGRDAEERQRREDCRGKVDSLLDRERKSAENFVQVGEMEINGGGFMEEKWRFQTEILRAECNFLRMEREIALKKMERNRTQIEITLRSAVEGLVSGRNKIHEGKSVKDVFEEEIKYLEETLGELQRGPYAAKDLKEKKCSNFDRKASLLRRRLESLGGLLPEDKRSAIKEIQPTSGKDVITSVALDTKQKETPNSIMTLWEKDGCSGRCKYIVRRIVEQVRSERDQWSQMQEMVGRVRDEMEELQACREFWEDRAMDSEFESRSLRFLVQEWRQKATSFEAKAKDLETEVYSLRMKLKKEVAATAEKKENRRQSLPRSPFRDIGNSIYK